MPGDNVQLTMNNVQWAEMRLYEDAGMGCGAWVVDVVDGLMGWGKIGGAKIHKISFVERFNWGYIGCMEYTYSFHLPFQQWYQQKNVNIFIITVSAIIPFFLRDNRF